MPTTRSGDAMPRGLNGHSRYCPAIAEAYTLRLQRPVLAGDHHLLTRVGRRQRPLLHQPAPAEHLVGAYPVKTRDLRDRRPRQMRLFNDRRLLLSRLFPSPLHRRDHLHSVVAASYRLGHVPCLHPRARPWQAFQRATLLSHVRLLAGTYCKVAVRCPWRCRRP